MPDRGTQAPTTAGESTQLAVLVRARGWNRFGVFCAEYQKAARTLDKALLASTPSRAQLHRWLSGQLRRLPYVNHCRVLEAMFPGWTAEQLLGPPVESTPATPAMLLTSLDTTVAPVKPLGAHADVAAIFASRSEFMANVSPLELFDGASRIEAAGLSLNMLCQQFADQRLRQLVERGARIEALFLKPGGDAIAAREAEEGIAPGQLSTLTSLNIDLLLRIRDGAPSDVQENVAVKVYDEPIRFNLTFVDAECCIVQPYLPALRGVDSPTLLVQRNPGSGGLYEVFERVYRWLEERSTQL